MKILLADDDTNIHLVLSMWLARHGHEVIGVYDGREALEKIRDERFDGLISDVNMPLMKGNELVREVLQMPNRPRVIILLTSRCDVSALKREIGSNTVHYLSKPFSPAGLAALIKRWEEEGDAEDVEQAGSVGNPG